MVSDKKKCEVSSLENSNWFIGSLFCTFICDRGAGILALHPTNRPSCPAAAAHPGQLCPHHQCAGRGDAFARPGWGGILAAFAKLARLEKVYLVAFILPTAAWLLALSIIITWLFIRSDGSVVVCTFFHAVFNTWSQSILAAEGFESTYILVIVFMAAAAAYLDLRYGKSLSAESHSL